MQNGHVAIIFWAAVLGSAVQLCLRAGYPPIVTPVLTTYPAAPAGPLLPCYCFLAALCELAAGATICGTLSSKATLQLRLVFKSVQECSVCIYRMNSICQVSCFSQPL